MSTRRVLILFAHPSLERSEINTRLLAAARADGRATVVDLYAEYPDYLINIDLEQQRLCEHDVVMFLFPLYWYSTPAMLKEWQDLVLEFDFAYGPGGTALHGKHFICACTAGGPAAAYESTGYNRFTLRELLRPLEQTADLCGMRYLPPYALFGSRTAVEEGRCDEHIQGFRQLLDVLAQGSLKPLYSDESCTVNERLSATQKIQGNQA